jgi:hypothetical protein
MQGFSNSHTPNKMTCTACHLGNNSAYKKDEAHKNIVIVPGNLSNISSTCGKCHLGIDFRVKNSLMNTMSGIISIDKHIFDENKNLDSIFNIHHLKDKTPAEKHLRNKCASCHIGNEKNHPNPITEKSRGGGCLACHLNYSENAKKAHKNYLNSNKVKLPEIHPSVSLNITDNHCFGCHSRSGRIATNYQGWHETILKDTLNGNPNFRVLQDKRVFSKQPADIHHDKGLSCIDCHDAMEVMGDGITYSHQEQAVKITCTDCHFNNNPKTILFNELNEADKRILRLRNKDTTVQFLVSPNSKKIIYNVIRESDSFVFISKNENKKQILSKPSKYCKREVHKNISCSTCHTKWSPQCISCHTTYDPNDDGFDLLDKKWKIGNWIEKGDLFLTSYPTLGVITENEIDQIKSFSIGMNIHLKKDSNKKEEFHRYFAPTSAHTISKKGANCITCHLEPATIGYGRGILKLQKNGTFIFHPKYPKEKDGLPIDAWIPFLSKNKTGKATRKNARPFSVKEQKRILRVGVCISCHKTDKNIQQAMLKDYTNTLKKISNQCILPNF